MDTKEQLVNHIREWIEIDNGISGLYVIKTSQRIVPLCIAGWF